MWRATQTHLLADRWADPVFSLAGDCLGSSRIGRAEEEEEDDEEEEEEAVLAGIRVVTCGPSETMSLVFLMRSAIPRAVAVLLLTRVVVHGHLSADMSYTFVLSLI